MKKHLGLEWSSIRNEQEQWVCDPFSTQRLDGIPHVSFFATDEMSESRQTHVTLHDIDPQALEQLVQYAYTAEIVVGEGNVQVRIGCHLHCPMHKFMCGVSSTNVQLDLFQSMRSLCLSFLLLGGAITSFLRRGEDGLHFHPSSPRSSGLPHFILYREVGHAEIQL